jgi:hypothetical protein
MVQRTGESCRYEPTPHGLATITALWLQREKLIGPLIGEVSKCGETAMPTANPVALDLHYEFLQTQRRVVLQGLAFAA